MDTTEQTTQERRLVERGPGIASGLRDLPKHLGIKTMSAGLVSAIFGCSGPALIVIGAASFVWSALRWLSCDVPSSARGDARLVQSNARVSGRGCHQQAS